MKKLFLIPAFLMAFAWVACDNNPNGTNGINSPGMNDSNLQDNDPYQDQSIDSNAPGSITDTNPSSNRDRNSDTALDVSGDQSPEVK